MIFQYKDPWMDRGTGMLLVEEPSCLLKNLVTSNWNWYMGDFLGTGTVVDGSFQRQFQK
jgi:hypothetical protein